MFLNIARRIRVLAGTHVNQPPPTVPGNIGVPQDGHSVDKASFGEPYLPRDALPHFAGSERNHHGSSRTSLEP
jgi:hypothetical protein